MMTSNAVVNEHEEVVIRAPEAARLLGSARASIDYDNCGLKTQQLTSTRLAAAAAGSMRCNAIDEAGKKLLEEECCDALWEKVANLELASADSGNLLDSSCKRAGGRTQLSPQRLNIPRELAGDLHVDREGKLEPVPQPAARLHRSLDFDIHINEPDIVKLQDRVYLRPLSDHHLGDRISFVSESAHHDSLSAPPQHPSVMPASSHTSPPSSASTAASRLRSLSPLNEKGSSAREAISNLGTVEGEVGMKTGGRAAAANSGPLSASGPLGIGAIKQEEGDGLIMRSPSSDQVARTTKGVEQTRSLARRQTMTKSKQLVEPQFLIASPTAASDNNNKPPKIPQDGIPGRAAQVAKQSSSAGAGGPAMGSSKRGEDQAEDDPFKDVDFLERSFKQGNWKPITLLQWAAFFVLTGCLVCSLTLPVLEQRQVWGLHLWRWFLVVLVVLCGRLVSGWFIRLLVIVFEKNFLLKQKVLYFVYGLRKAVQNFVWIGLALLAWMLLFDPRVERSARTHKALSIITKVLQCFLIAAAFWLLKIVLVKSLASSFHVSTFFERIQQSILHQHLLEALYGPPLSDLTSLVTATSVNANDAVHVVVATPTAAVSSASGAGAKKPDAVSNKRAQVQELQNLDRKDVSAGLMSRLMDLVRHPGFGTLITTFDEYDAPPDDNIGQISNEMEAKIVANRIFKNVAREGSRCIEEEDLLRFVTRQDVTKVLSYFEGAKETGRISKKALKNWVVHVYQERRALAQSLNDTKTAVDELHRIASVIVSIVIIVVWLLVLGITSTHVLVLLTSQLLLVGFMFSNTVKQVFEAIVFVFVMHPYDVGDRCVVDGAQLVVEEMRILYTIFLRPDNEKVYYPNAVLSVKPISNLRRSPEMKDILNFSVHISTPAEKITVELKGRIAAYLDRKSEHWAPKFSLLVKELEDLNRLRLTITVQHTINFQNYGDRMNRRSDLLLELKKSFHELGIEYRLLTQPLHLVPSSSTYYDCNNTVTTPVLPNTMQPSTSPFGC